jgi:hypothetical protein
MRLAAPFCPIPCDCQREPRHELKTNPKTGLVEVGTEVIGYSVVCRAENNQSLDQPEAA